MCTCGLLPHRERSPVAALLNAPSLAPAVLLTLGPPSFAAFYVVPVALAAWIGSTTTVSVVSITSAVTWQAANALAGEQLSATWIPVWTPARDSASSCHRAPA